MIEKLQYETGFEIECNTCGITQSFEVGNNWGALISESYNEGWRAKKTDDGIWEHCCPECVKKYIEQLKESSNG